MMLIDGDRLREWLESQRESLAQSAEGRHAADGPDDHTALRMDGGVASLFLVINQLDNFQVARTRTPIREMSVPTEHKVRRHDPGTSFDSALLQTPEKSRRLYIAIHMLLSRKPMTDDEVIAVMERRQFPHTASGVRARRSELVKAGWVRDSGTKRSSAAGHPSIVWEAVP